MDDDEQALDAVLGNEPPDDASTLARQPAERDVAAIRRGLRLLAADTPPAARRRERPAGRWLLVAAALVVVAAGLVVAIPALTRDDSTDGRGPSLGAPAASMTLRERASAANRIVVGTVTKVDRGTMDAEVEGEVGDRYVLATVRIDEAIKGAGGQVIAFSYDFGSVITIEGSSRPWNVGDHVLLFLLPDIDTVSADMQPPHMQVAEGEAGRYFLDLNGLIDADFTLEDVRRAAE